MLGPSDEHGWHGQGIGGEWSPPVSKFPVRDLRVCERLNSEVLIFMTGQEDIEVLACQMVFGIP